MPRPRLDPKPLPRSNSAAIRPAPGFAARGLEALSAALVLCLLALAAAAALTASLGPRARALAPQGPARSLQQTSLFTATADSYVLDSAPTSTFGGASQLLVGVAATRQGRAVHRTLLRFEGLTSTIPAGVEIDEATLRLEHLGGSGSLLIAARVLTGTWEEALVTWDTQPGSVPPEAQRAVGSGAGTYDWDVQALVQAWTDGLPEQGILLRAVDETTPTLKAFRSREDSTASGPKVSLEVLWHRVTPTPPPSPSSTNTATPEASPTTAVRATATPPASATSRASATSTATGSVTARATERATASATATLTATLRATASPTPTLRATATLTPTASATTTRPTPTSTPGGGSATPERTATLLPPSVATADPGDLDLSVDVGCGAQVDIGQRVEIRLLARLERPRRGPVIAGQGMTDTIVSLSLFPGPRHLGDFAIRPGEPLAIPFAPRDPAGPRTIVAELLEGEGAVASCGLDVVDRITPAPSPTPIRGIFHPPTPVRPEIFLPFASKMDGPAGSGPGDLAPKPADAVEAAIEWLNHLPHPRSLVVAQGNGGHHRLSLWQLGAGGLPEWVSDADIRQGFDLRLERLTPGQGAAEGIDRLLVSAARLGNGQLWLRSWTVDAGQLIPLDAHGYGPVSRSPDAPDAPRVARYAIASRSVKGADGLRHYQVLTPIVTADDQARVLSWHVNPDTGQISGRDDTGDWQEIAPGSDLDVAYLPDAQVQLDPDQGFTSDDGYDTDLLYAMTFRSKEGLQGQWILRVSDNGSIGWFGGGETGVNVRGTGDVSYGMTVARVLPIARTGFLTARRDGAADDPEVFTWDYRSVLGEQGLVPHRIGRSSWDQAPDDKGVVLAIDDPGDPDFIGTDVDGERAIVSDASWEDTGAGDGQLFLKTPLGKGPAGGMASVTKVMTLLLALEAVSDGEVSLDDIVLVPAEGAESNPAWMSPPLAGGDQVELRTLLHGLMKRSSNGAARSIAWHVAGAKHGNGLSYPQRIDAFVADMNARANGLGMSDSLYCAVQGGSHSTPQDQVTLWREAEGHPLFQDFAGVNVYSPPCGKDANDDPKCFAGLAKGDMGLPGLDGEKNGLKTNNSGVGYSQGQLACDAFSSGSTFDACRQCRIGVSTRLGRTLLGAVQQSDESANDVRDLVLYGIQRQYTPDRRGAGLELNPVPAGKGMVDFGLSSLGGQVNEPPLSLVLTEKAVLRVCTLSANAGLGQALPASCAERDAPFLGAGGPHRPDPQLEMVRVDAIAESEADLLTAHVDGAFLRLQIWRVLPRERSY